MPTDIKVFLNQLTKCLENHGWHIHTGEPDTHHYNAYYDKCISEFCTNTHITLNQFFTLFPTSLTEPINLCIMYDLNKEFTDVSTVCNTCKIPILDLTRKDVIDQLILHSKDVIGFLADGLENLKYKPQGLKLSYDFLPF